MSGKLENNLLMFEVEKEQVELRLKDQIKSIRYTLDALESKLDSKEKLYESDGLQGNGVNIDTYLTKLVAYEKVTSQLRKNL